MYRSAFFSLRSFYIPFIALAFVFICRQHAFSASNSRILYNNQKLSIQASNVPLKEILNEIADKTGVYIVYYGSIDTYITLTLDNVPFEKGLKRLLKDCNFSFIYKKDISSLSEDFVLRSITIISDEGSAKKTSFGAEPDPVLSGDRDNLHGTSTPPPVNPVISENKITADSGPGANEGISFSRETRAEFRKIERNSVINQIDASQVEIYTNFKGNQYKENMKGLKINTILDDSLVSRLGIKQGDVVTNVNGTAITSSEQLAEQIQDAISGLGSGMILRIEVNRDDGIEPIYINMQ